MGSLLGDPLICREPHRSPDRLLSGNPLPLLWPQEWERLGAEKAFRAVGRWFSWIAGRDRQGPLASGLGFTLWLGTGRCGLGVSVCGRVIHVDGGMGLE